MREFAMKPLSLSLIISDAFLRNYYVLGLLNLVIATL